MLIRNNGRNPGPDLLIFDANGDGLDIDWISIRGLERMSKRSIRKLRWLDGTESSPVWLSVASH